MADPMEEAMAGVQTMMQQTHLAAAVQTMTAAYDSYACTAMQALIEKSTIPALNSLMIDAVAHTAWQIADAMMEERKKRGLGGFNNNEG